MRVASVSTALKMLLVIYWLHNTWFNASSRVYALCKCRPERGRPSFHSLSALLCAFLCLPSGCSCRVPPRAGLCLRDLARLGRTGASLRWASPAARGRSLLRVWLKGALRGSSTLLRRTLFLSSCLEPSGRFHAFILRARSVKHVFGHVSRGIGALRLGRVTPPKRRNPPRLPRFPACGDARVS